MIECSIPSDRSPGIRKGWSMMNKDIVLVAALLFVWALTSPQTRTAVQYAKQAPAGTISRLSAALRGWQEPGRPTRPTSSESSGPTRACSPPGRLTARKDLTAKRHQPLRPRLRCSPLGRSPKADRLWSRSGYIRDSRAEDAAYEAHGPRRARASAVPRALGAQRRRPATAITLLQEHSQPAHRGLSSTTDSC